jgi:phosphatidyl-myo-inositol dimannoside synthase
MPQPLRVLSIGHSYVLAVNRAFLRELAADPDFRVTVAAPQFFRGDLRPLAVEPEPPGSPLELVALPAHWTRFIHCFGYDRAALTRLVRAGGFDVVHAWQEPYIRAGAQIARAVGPTAARFSFRTAQNYPKWYPLPFSRYDRRVRQRAQGWVAGGELVRAATVARGFDPQRGWVIPLAVDLSAFQPLPEPQRQRLRTELKLTPPVVGYAGRLVAEKGLDVLMAALEALPAAVPWSLLALGSGPYREKLLAWAARRGWEGRVRMRLVDHSEVPQYLGLMDVLAVPSQTTRNWREQFGRVLIEAMACGVPLLASDSGEIPRVVGPAGRVLPERDPTAWTAALAELLADPAVRADLAGQGLTRVGRYSAAAVAQRYRDFFRWLLRQPLPRGACAGC